MMRESAFDITIEPPETNISEERLLMFLNEPILNEFYRDKDLVGPNLDLALRKVYGNQKIIRRYQIFQQAKQLLITQKNVDISVDFLITHLQSIQQNSAKQILQTQRQKEKLIQGFKQMQRKQKYLQNQFLNIKNRIQESNHKFDLLDNLKKSVQKIVQKTETIRALTISNKSLKDENMKLTMKLQESEKMINKLNNEVKYLKEKER